MKSDSKKKGCTVILDQISRLFDERTHRKEAERAALVSDVTSEIGQISWEDLAHEDLPRRGRVHLFPLGECRVIRLSSIGGETTLYLGSNGKLYEYGPATIEDWDDDRPIDSNPIALRTLDLKTLSVQTLMQCRDLLRSLWI